MTVDDALKDFMVAGLAGLIERCTVPEELEALLGALRVRCNTLQVNYEEILHRLRVPDLSSDLPTPY